MPAMRKILVVGDSHTDAVKRALRERGNQAEHLAIEAFRYAVAKNGKTIGDLSSEEILERVAGLGPDDLVVSMVGGNQHQVVALVQHPQPFDFHDPDGGAVAEDAYLIPYAQMQDFFDTGIRAKDGLRLQALRQAARCPVWHCVPPPPKEDMAHILRSPESAFVNAGIAEKGVSAAPLRLKVWRLQARVLAQLAAEFDIGLFRPPAQTTTAEGFLAPAYYADDATHGNTLYGAALLEQFGAAAAGDFNGKSHVETTESL